VKRRRGRTFGADTEFSADLPASIKVAARLAAGTVSRAEIAEGLRAAAVLRQRWSPVLLLTRKGFSSARPAVRLGGTITARSIGNGRRDDGGQ